MIIAINARTLRAVPRDGIGWFTLEVVRGMVRNHPEHRFVMIGDRKYRKVPGDGDRHEERLVGSGQVQGDRLPGADESNGNLLPAGSDSRKERLSVEGSNVEYVTIPLRTVHPFLWHVWHEYLLPPALKRTGADILIAPDGMMPLLTDIQ